MFGEIELLNDEDRCEEQVGEKFLGQEADSAEEKGFPWWLW